MHKIILSICLVTLAATLQAQHYVSFTKTKKAFTLAEQGNPVPIFISPSELPGVKKAVRDFQLDVQKVTGTLPQLSESDSPSGPSMIIAGTIGHSALIEQLVNSKKIDVSKIKGKWETFQIETVANPLPGVKQALVIAGSDKRATIFGIYDLSQQIGVSPWNWWADVPVVPNKNIYVIPGTHSAGTPKVKYRGIFINDEQPALGGWVQENFGGFNSKFYTHVFELILRNKGNFLWPAMWGQEFYVKDSLNPILADEYGVVISTSHHEPMMRAHAEWKNTGGAQWDYSVNAENLRKFWKEGIERMGSNESVVTLAMRGDGDEPMSEESNVKLLQQIVADQRKILVETTGKKLEEIPQVWALYKEVQDYYDKGMRVDDDITLLLCDDNWGNIRKLPRLNDPQRIGGYGIYYHFDYVGGPRNYKWLNTSPIVRTWEQMNLAYAYGADRIWIVNVGDIKPMEFPISFFLEYAWDPTRWNQSNLHEYAVNWCTQQFGKKYAEEIASMIELYTKYNSRRKPELLAPDTYSFLNYREAERIVEEYNTLAERANGLYESLPQQYKDAYYQLVLYPILACANLNEMKVTAGLNKLYAAQDRAATNDLAAKVRDLFKRDQELKDYYNKKMANGKWNHFMDQTHISYTYWQQPNVDVVPEVTEINLPKRAEMSVAVEGKEEYWPRSTRPASLPRFDAYNQQQYYMEIYNQGTIPFDYTVSADKPWIKLSEAGGKVEKQVRVWVTVDWSQLPKGENMGMIFVKSGNEQPISIAVSATNPEVDRTSIKGFVENNGLISIKAEHFTATHGQGEISWKVIPDLGRTGSSIKAFPVTAEIEKPGNGSPYISYTINISEPGDYNIQFHVAPTIDFHNRGALRFGVSLDDAEPRVIDLDRFNSNSAWEQSVANNVKIGFTRMKIDTTGKHTLKFWLMDPGVALQHIVISRGPLPQSYLAPPETYHAGLPEN